MKAPALYERWHISRGDERLGLFSLVAQQYTISSVLYPGCFVHITPSLVFSSVVYVDMDRRAASFFQDAAVSAYVAHRQTYAQQANIAFHTADYREGIPEPEESFDLLISQYAGFVSLSCKRYLKSGGWLLANDSHGDASLAALDPAYELAAVIQEVGGRYEHVTDALESYFRPRARRPHTRDAILQRERGATYTKTGSAYIFQKIRGESP